MPSSAASQRSCRSLPRNSRSRSTVVTLMVRPWIASEGTPPCTRIGEEIVGELRRRAFSRVTPTKVGAHIPETGVYGPRLSPVGANLGPSSPATTTSRLSPRRKPGPINADVECLMLAARQYVDEELPFIERALNLVVRVPE